MRVSPTVFADPAALGRALAAEIADEISEATRGGRRYVRGCPGGRSPHPVYLALADEVTARGLDLTHVAIVMMDEYVDHDPRTGTYRRIDPTAAHSCVRFGRTEIVQRLNAAAGPGHGIDTEHFLFPDPSDPAEYDRRIGRLGGVDLFLLASGAGDGHIAFNPVGASADTRTHVTALAEQTRTDNLATFPTFRGLDDVPSHGVTIGIATIREQSRRVVMIVHGADKAQAAHRLTSAEHYEPDWPATIFTDCARPRLYLDQAALTAAARLAMSA